jgi:hypothetical protein
MKLISMLLVVLSSLFLSGCATTGGVQYRNSHVALGISGTSAAPQQIIYQQGVPQQVVVAGGNGCPPGSRYDGRGCALVNPALYNQWLMNRQAHIVPQQQVIIQQAPIFNNGGYMTGPNTMYRANPATCPRVSTGNGGWRCQ